MAPLCAGLASACSGLTTYGDAILFHICATLSRISGLAAPAVDEDEELRFAVLCTTIMSVVTIFVAWYYSRGELRRCVPYGLTMAATGLAMVPVGSSLLFNGDLGPVKVGTGVFFACFATYYLTLSFRDEAVAARLRGGGAVAPPGSAVADPLPQREPAAAAAAAAAGKGGAAAEPAGPAEAAQGPGTDAAAAHYASRGRSFLPWPEPEAAWGGTAEDCRVQVAGAPGAGEWWSLRALAEFFDGTLHPLSHTTPPSRTLAVLLVAGTGAGFLNGLLGTGGPPQMLAWAVIGAHKDLARATFAVYASLEVPLRLYLTATGPGWNPSRDGALYASVGSASFVCYLAGTWLRRYCDTRAILRVMLVVVGLSSSVLMGALESRGVAGGCAAGAGVVGACLLALRLAPRWVEAVCCLPVGLPVGDAVKAAAAATAEANSDSQRAYGAAGR